MSHITFNKAINKLEDNNKKLSKKLWDDLGLGFSPSKTIDKVNAKDSVWGKAVIAGFRNVDISIRYKAMKDFIKVENQNIRMGKDEFRKRPLNPNTFFDLFYFEVPQPMPIYYSTDKLYEHEMGKTLFIFNNDLDVYRFMDQINKGEIEAAVIAKFKSRNEIVFKDTVSVLLNTHQRDKYIPFDVGYKDNEIKYSNVKAKDIYIKIYKMAVVNHKAIMLWTSSGKNLISPLGSKVSAAVKFSYKYANVNIYRTREIKDELYQKQLNKILTGKRTTIDDLRLFNNIFNPISPHYLDGDGAIIAAYGRRIKRKDMDKVLRAQRIKKILMGELIKMLPDLAEGLRKFNTPEDLGTYLRKMRDLALEKGSIKEQTEVFSLILHSAYGNTIGNPDTTGTMPLVLGENAGFNNNVIQPNDDYIKNDTTLQLQKAETKKQAIAEDLNTKSGLDLVQSLIPGMDKPSSNSNSRTEPEPAGTRTRLNEDGSLDDDEEFIDDNLNEAIPRPNPILKTDTAKNLLDDEEFENLAHSVGLIDGLMVDE